MRAQRARKRARVYDTKTSDLRPYPTLLKEKGGKGNQPLSKIQQFPQDNAIS